MAPTVQTRKDEHKEETVTYDVNLPYKPADGVAHKRTDFPEYLPSWDDQTFHEDPAAFEYLDPATRAAADMPNLFSSDIVTTDITPRLGTIVEGINLKGLSDAAKDELALLITKRKVVVLRDQSDFLAAGPKYQQDLMAYFGVPNVQPVTGSVKGYPGFHIIHRDNNQDEIEAHLRHKMTSTLWHQDVSYERQPPGYIMLGILACPDVGGDTVFADTTEAYRMMIEHVRSVEGIVRRNPVESIHPIVRVHPVTGEKSIWVNAEFVTGIAGFKKTESDLLLKFLVEHVVMGHDFQARVMWEKDSVVLFDGRNTLHTATVDYDSRIQARHIFRLASMTEKPIAVKQD
ncbi:sulfonate dioxygenase, partial [Lecanoromycetidae sp. Uapishka_2]